MKASTIKWNTPTMPTKVAFYNALVSFYETTVGNPNVTLNDEQQRCVDAIGKFEAGDTHIHYHYSVGNIDLSVVRNLTPKHHRKRNLYRILVAFFDSSIKAVNNAESEEQATPTYKALTLAVGDCIAAVPVGVVFFAPADIATHRAEKVKENKGKKKYTVSVNARYKYTTEVIAESREEAEELAEKEAQFSSGSDWDFVDYMDTDVDDEEEL